MTVGLPGAQTGACAALVERGDPLRFAATLAAPPAMRGALFTLYAFNLEVARAAWASTEPLIAEMRLQWWRDAVEEAGQGVARAHEVMRPLAALIQSADLPLPVLDALIEARRWDIYRDPFANTAAFDAHLDATAGGLMWLAARALGAPPCAEPIARAAGWASGLASYLQAVPDLETRGRFPLVDGRPEAVAALAQRGLARLAEARQGRGLLGPAAPALLSAAQAGALLRLAADQPKRVANGTLQVSEFQRRGRLVWAALSGRW